MEHTWKSSCSCKGSHLCHTWHRCESYMANIRAMDEIWMEPVRIIHEAGKDYEWKLMNSTRNMYDITEDCVWKFN